MSTHKPRLLALQVEGGWNPILNAWKYKLSIEYTGAAGGLHTYTAELPLEDWGKTEPIAAATAAGRACWIIQQATRDAGTSLTRREIAGRWLELETMGRGIIPSPGRWALEGLAGGTLK